MNTFIDALLEEMRKIHARTYYNLADSPDGSSVPMPYAVLDFPNVVPNEIPRDDMTLTIGVWGTETTLQETDVLVYRLQTELHRKLLAHASFSARLHFLVSAPVPDPNPGLVRREIRFLAKVYWK